MSEKYAFSINLRPLSLESMRRGEDKLHIIKNRYWESMAGSVIQATGTVEFEDGLRTGGCWGP